jgi:hypothetical protein
MTTTTVAVTIHLPFAEARALLAALTTGTAPPAETTKAACLAIIKGLSAAEGAPCASTTTGLTS